MYAKNEDHARRAFDALKVEMQDDAERAVKCLEKDLNALLAHFKFDPRCWTALRTTNAIENINRQLKRRTQTMDTIGEGTLRIVLAFTALRLEMTWSKIRVDSSVFNKIREDSVNTIEASVAEMGLLN